MANEEVQLFNDDEIRSENSDRGGRSEIDLLKWEIDLLKREKELLDKERRNELNIFNNSEHSGRRNEEHSAFRMGHSEVTILIPEFNPNSANNSVNDWINGVDNLKDIYQWDEKTTLFYASLRLTDAARFWYISKKNEITSWSTLKSEISEAFPCARDDTATLLQIMNRRRQANECVENYVYSIVALASKIKLTEDVIIKYVISGLNNQNLKNVLIASNCETINSLLKKIKEYEEIENQDLRRENLRTVQSRSGYNENKYNYWKNTSKSPLYKQEGKFMSNKRVSESEDRQNSANKRQKIEINNKKKCFKCGEIGHFAATCKKNNAKVCYKCNKPGHYARNCTHVSCINSSNENTYSEYYKNIGINGKVLLGYCDLGSECTTLKIENATEMDLKIEDSERVLYGFGGVMTKAIGVIKSTIEVDNIKRMIELVIVPNETQAVPIILGRNFLDAKDIKVIKSWGKYEIVCENQQDKNESTAVIHNEEERKGKENPSVKSPLTLEDIQVNDNMNEEIKVRLLFLANKYRKCFAKELTEIGKTDIIQMKITLKEDKVVNYHPYRVPYAQKPVLKQIISDLLRLDIIQLSTSEYASPVILVPKKNGEQRMCVDYRRLNSITKREIFPTPNVEELLNSLANKKVFSSLDMMSGYHQIGIEESSRHLTAFITSEGHFEYKRVPFGLTNSPAVFMRLMSIIFRNIQCSDIVAYMDDVLVATDTVEKHFEVLELVFKELCKAGITLNVKKCVFMKVKLEFLGHEITENGIQPGIKKTLTIESYKRPETAREVKQFLGLTGYFRRFVKNYSLIALPLNRLLRKNIPFEWTSETEESFQKLINILTSRPILTLYNERMEHELHTDASSHGLAGVLLQKENDGLLYAVAFYSRTTTSAESKWHSYELETLAVVESVERFKYYLLHKHFKVITDCNSLKQTKEKKHLIPRIARWWLRLAEFDFELEFRSGQKMAHVDALSRNNHVEGSPVENVAEKVMAISLKIDDWLALLQQQDSYLLEIKGMLENNEKKDDKVKGIKGTYRLVKGRIYKMTNDGDKFVIPNGIRWKIIHSAHDKVGHCGIEKTLNNIKKHFWFPNIKKIVTKYINSCIECLYHKERISDKQYQVHVYERKPIPFHTVHCDYLGPFPKSKKGNLYVIGVVDAFSKFVILKATKSSSTKEALKTFEEFTQYFGMPTQIVTDRGSAFTSKDFVKFCEENAIKHILTAVQTPRANGQIERYFRTTKGAIATMSEDEAGRDWDTNILSIQWALNSSQHCTTQKSPHEILMAYKPRSILKNKLILALHDDDEHLSNEKLECIRESVSKRIKEKQIQQADKVNREQKLPRKYQEDELVLIKQEAIATGQSRKLLPRYKGPYKVKKILPHDRYVITDPDFVQRSQKAYESIHAADNLKPWLNLEDISLDDNCSDEEESTQ